MPRPPLKLKSLTIQEKIDIIDSIDNGKYVRQVSDELGISKNTLHYIYKNKEKIRSEALNKPVSFKWLPMH